jgi:hypothetical protein
MSDEDKRTYKLLGVIAVLTICMILLIVAGGTLYAEHACVQMWMLQAANNNWKLPDFCHKGELGKFVLEFLGITVGVLGAIKLLG